MTTPVLETERLLLRPLRLADAVAIQHWFANWNIIRRLSTNVPWPYPADGAETFLREMALPAMASGESLKWAITLEGDDALIGAIDFTFEDTGLGNRGFWLAEHLWGQGYMTEAVIAVQNHVLITLGVERIVVLNASDNVASRRVKEKTGATYLGQIEVAHHDGSHLADQWEITRESWRAANRHHGDRSSWMSWMGW